MKVNKSEKGSSLVIVLGMLAVLMLMAVSFSVIMRVERAGTTNLRHNLTAQNGLQSAIAHALRDIDENLGDSMNPAAWEYGIMASNGDDISFDILQPGDSHDAVKVSILSERAQRHLNPTTRALVKNAKVDWRLLYAGIPLSNYAADGTDRLDEDSIVGRVAYVAVNTTGYLDPNMVSETGVLAFPEETHQLNNTSFAAIGKKNVGFSNYSFLDAREEEKFAFTSFADLVTLNESLMYDDGRIKGAPKMFINFFPPNKTSCLFLPDVFGPAAAFGMSPYPPRVERDSNDPFADVVLTEAVKVDGVATLTEDVMQNVYVAFCNMFARENWAEESSYGEGKTQYTNPVRNVEWPFVYMGSIKRSTLTRADLALLSFAEYYSYKSGRVLGDNEYVEMAIDVINEGGRPKINDVLDAPCFKPVPMVSSLLGYTEKPETEDDDIKIYHHDGNGKFSPVGDDAVIPPETTTAKYYAKYELPVSFVVSATSPYKNSVDASLDGKIMFGPGADGKDLFAHIHGKISGNPKIVIDPESKFADSVKSGEDLVIQDKDLCSVNAGLGGIKVVRELEQKIEVYIQCKDPSRKSTEDAPITIKEIKNLFKWEDAQFDNSLEKYSIDVFAQIDVKASGQEVQYVPGKRIRSRKGPEGYVHFKLPLFGKGEKHRVGYAMALDPRFASATYCLNEFRENGAIESFPFWVNNAMVEKFGEFSKLKAFEMNADDPDDLATGGRTPDIANPYGKLAMGFNIDDDGLEDKSFWESLFNFGDFSKDYGTPYPDTLHKVPGGIQLVNDGGFDKKDLQIDFGTRGSGIDNLGDFGSFCIGPWETISLYRTQTPNNEYDFHTVLDFFTVDNPSVLMPGKVNLNAPPLLMTQEKSYGRVKFAMDHKGSYSNPKPLSIGGNVKPDVYVEASNGLNPEPLMAVLYGLGFDYRTSWEIASRIISQNIHYDQKDGIRYFKDISQLGYSDSANDALLTYILNEDNSEIFDEADVLVYSDQQREQLIGKIAKHVTTRGQTFTIVIRSDAFTPKLGSDKEGVTLASKVAIVEAWRDTEPARDTAGEIVRDEKGNIVNYHNWHIRSVRIVE